MTEQVVIKEEVKPVIVEMLRKLVPHLAKALTSEEHTDPDLLEVRNLTYLMWHTINAFIENAEE